MVTSRPSDLEWNYTTAFLGFQHVDSKSWTFSASIIMNNPERSQRGPEHQRGRARVSNVAEMSHTRILENL